MKKPRFAQPLADIIGPSIAQLCGKAGFSVVEVVTHWDEIVGPDLAPRSQPLRLQWPREENGEAATLFVRVEGPYAIEFQYAAPVVIERINAYFGWRCVGRIALRQGPVPRKAAPPVFIPPPPEAVDRVRAEIGAFEDEALAASLARLGALVRQARRKS
ncbi:MAG: DciA family protein [Pseudomonadota bacterium]